MKKKLRKKLDKRYEMALVSLFEREYLGWYGGTPNGIPAETFRNCYLDGVAAMHRERWSYVDWDYQRLLFLIDESLVRPSMKVLASTRAGWFEDEGLIELLRDEYRKRHDGKE